MTGFRIQTLSAFIAVDPKDGDEGVVAAHIDGVWYPLTCADQARIDSLRPHAQDIARATGITIKLVEFSVRRDVETL